MLDGRLRLVEETRFDQELDRTGAVTSTLLVLDEGTCSDWELTVEQADVLVALDGATTLDQAVARVARREELSKSEAAELRRDVRDLARDLLETGALELVVTTSDLFDEHPGAASCETQFRQFGGVRSFSGAIATVRCFEDNVLLRAQVSEPGNGRVLVVDGGGSFACALLGDNIAEIAVVERLGRNRRQRLRPRRRRAGRAADRDQGARHEPAAEQERR